MKKASGWPTKFSLSLPSTAGKMQDLSLSEQENWVLFFMPGPSSSIYRPSEKLLARNGVRGCTAESCAINDAMEKKFNEMGFTVFGVTTQNTEAQEKFRQEKEIGFHFLSDPGLLLKKALPRRLRLGTIEENGAVVYRRFAVIGHYFCSAPRFLIFRPKVKPENHPQKVLDELTRDEKQRERAMCFP